MGNIMLQFKRIRFVAAPLIVAALVPVTTASAWAFSQETVQPGGNSNSTFGDPNDRFTTGNGAHPFGSNGPVVQFGVQQGPGAPFGRFQGNSDNNNWSPLDSFSNPRGKLGE